MKPYEKTAKHSVQLNDAALTTLSFLTLFLGWLILAWIINDPSVLPGPAPVCAVAIDEILNGALLHHVGATLYRVLLGFAGAMLIGTGIGLAMGFFPRLGRWIQPWVVFFLNLPALVVIVLCYLWLGLSETAAIIAITVNKAAMVAVNMREGVRTLSPDIADMARMYRLSPMVQFRHILLPQLAPFIATSVRNGLAMIWKIVLVAEFLGRGDGVGFQIHTYFQLFETTYVLAYALSFVAVMFAIEFLLLQPFEAKANRWRQTSELRTHAGAV